MNDKICYINVMLSETITYREVLNQLENLIALDNQCKLDTFEDY